MPALKHAKASLADVESHAREAESPYAAYVDLLPIPAAVVSHRDDALHVDVVNTPYRLTGLGTSSTESLLLRLLGARILLFLEGAARHEEFEWEVGDSIDTRFYRVMLAQEEGARDPNQCLVSLVDQTGARRTEASLRREVATDSLTGLPNRAGFDDLAGAADNLDAMAVMIVDLDRFSRVNACLGGLVGDELLISVARRLRGALRGADVLARIGGDEFGVLLHMDNGAGDAMEAARRMSATLSAPFRLSDFEVRVDCAIGIALGGDGDDPADMIRHAQFAVKRAKRTGRVEVYNQATYDRVRVRFAIETRLRRAIENGDMTLAFQPIHDLSSGRLVSFEALSRWTIDGASVSPAEFISVAEESGLIVPLGRWAVEEAARTIAAWDARAGGPTGVSVAVNLSAIQFQRDQVAPMVRAALDRHKVAGTRFTLELTESAIVADPDRISATLQAMKAMGTTIAMDDFGTGYSNLAYLQKLPIDVLKIDRSFITGMLADRDSVAIVRAILSLAQTLNMKTTAEGIENNELAQTLAALGCTYGQGYVFSRPVSADDAFAKLPGVRSA